MATTVALEDKTRWPVLMLNQDYRPLDVCRARRAVKLILRGKAEMVEDGRGSLHSLHQTFPIPSVIHLRVMVKKPPSIAHRVTRPYVFSRDKFTCQYCGAQPRHLTLDHVIPRYRGGEHSWENVVAACERCNVKKAGRTPAEARMTLRHLPQAPKEYIFTPRAVAFDEWVKWLA